MSKGERMVAKADQVGVSTFLSSDRLVSLSDTIFGVAMTLLATTLLPSVETVKGSAVEILQQVSWELVAVVLSFAVSGSYWVVQQQRLAMIDSVTPLQALLNFIFLFLIVLLPISTGLWGHNGTTSAVVIIYGTHLVLIAFLNLLLWINVHRTVAAHAQIVRSSLALTLFVMALAIGTTLPHIAPYLWFAVFAISFLSRNLTRRLYGA
jgi:uncharacterized membrane protein